MSKNLKQISDHLTRMYKGCFVNLEELEKVVTYNFSTSEDTSIIIRAVDRVVATIDEDYVIDSVIAEELSCLDEECFYKLKFDVLAGTSEKFINMETETDKTVDQEVKAKISNFQLDDVERRMRLVQLGLEMIGMIERHDTEMAMVVSQTSTSKGYNRSANLPYIEKIKTEFIDNLI